MQKGRLKKLILPLVFEQLLAVTVGVADTFMVSKVGEAAISGVSLVDGINLFVIQIMAALCSGGLVIISQYIGDKNEEKIKSACSHLEFMVTLFSLLIMSLFLVFRYQILNFLFGSVESNVMNAALTYLTVTCISFVFWGLYSSGSAILRCYEDTKTSLKVSILMNVLNVLLNAFFVFVLKIDVLGVALATLISRAIAGIIMRIIISRKTKTGKKSKFIISADMLKKILSMGLPSGIENGMFHVGKLALASVVATLGTSAIAANSISYQVIEFANIVGNTIGMALVVIVGQDIGANNKKQAKESTKHMIKLAYVGDWVSKIIFFIMIPFIVKLFSLSPEAEHMALLVLRAFCIAALPIWPLSFTMPNALRGAGDVRFTMVVSIISMWFGRVIVGFILVSVFHIGIFGVWIGMFVDWYIRGVSFYRRFKNNKWLEKRAV